jgi:hypothetical protein
MGVIAAGALAGGVGSAVEYCAEIAITDRKWDWSEFRSSVLIGTAIGAVTAGIGGIIAAKVARRAARKAAAEAAEKTAKEAEEVAARETLAKAQKAKQLEGLKAQRSARQRKQKLQEGINEADAAGKAKKLSPEDQKWLEADPRHKELAYDPDTKSYKPKEAKAGLQAEAEGTLDGPVTRSIDESGSSGGGDLVDGKGRAWDVKDASGGKDTVVDAAKPKGGKAGEDVLVDCSDLSAADQAKLQQDVARDLPPGSGEVRFTPKR